MTHFPLICRVEFSLVRPVKVGLFCPSTAHSDIMISDTLLVVIVRDHFTQGEQIVSVAGTEYYAFRRIYIYRIQGDYTWHKRIKIMMKHRELQVYSCYFPALLIQ